MARHRINQDGHMMWFDTDEEYYDYLADIEQQKREAYLREKKREQTRKRIWITIIAPIVIFFMASHSNANPILIVLFIAASIYITWKCRLWITYLSLPILLILLLMVSPGPDEKESGQTRSKTEEREKATRSNKAVTNDNTLNIKESVNTGNVTDDNAVIPEESLEEQLPAEEPSLDFSEQPQEDISLPEPPEMLSIDD